MNILNVTPSFAGNNIEITAEFKPNLIGERVLGTDSLVYSINGKAGEVTLDAGDLAFSDLATYQAGTVGAELQGVGSDLADLFDNWVEPFMLLNRKNCGEDGVITTASNQTRIHKHGNHITFERIGTASTYYTTILYHGGAMMSAKSSTAAISDAGLKTFSGLTPIPLPTTNGDSDYIYTAYLQRTDSSGYNGTNCYVATYSEGNDLWTIINAGTFEKTKKNYILCTNLSEKLPEIDANRNFIIFCRTRSGYAEGEAWFDIRTAPRQS